MKFLLAYTAVLIGLSNAQSNLYSQERNRPHRGGDPGGRLVDMKETKCPTFLTTFTCPLDPNDSGCDDLERPKLDKEALADMSDEDKAEMKDSFRDTKKLFKQKLLTCVCCDIISVDDLLAAKGEAEVSQEVALVQEEFTLGTEVQEGRDGTEGVTFNVFAGQDGGCSGSRGIHTPMEDSPQPIGYCQNHGWGKNAYSSMEVLGCSSNCLCFKQWASSNEDSDCEDDSFLKGWMIKFTCFDKCLQDCNGVNCGDTAQPDTGMTRLQLTGSGQICDKPVSEEELLAQCQTTGMIMEDGEFVDDFVRESSSQSGGFDGGMTSGGRPNSDSGGMFGSQGGQGGRPSMGGNSGMGSGGRPSSMGGGSSSGGRPNGMGSGGRPSSMGGNGSSNGGGMSGGRPSGMNSGEGSGRPNGMSGSNGGSGRPGSSSFGGRPSGMSGGSNSGGGKPDGVDIQSLLSQRCPEFDCANMSGQEIDCSRFDSMNTRGGRKNMLWCGCCRD